MDEAELEEWYQHQRELLEERALESVQKNVPGAQAKFDAAYRKLIASYQSMQETLYRDEQRREKIRKPIARLQLILSEWSQAPGIWFRLRVKQIQKWWFNRKIRRLLRT